MISDRCSSSYIPSGSSFSWLWLMSTRFRLVRSTKLGSSVSWLQFKFNDWSKFSSVSVVGSFCNLLSDKSRCLSSLSNPMEAGNSFKLFLCKSSVFNFTSCPNSTGSESNVVFDICRKLRKVNSKISLSRPLLSILSETVAPLRTSSYLCSSAACLTSGQPIFCPLFNHESRLETRPSCVTQASSHYRVMKREGPGNSLHRIPLTSKHAAKHYLISFLTSVSLGH